MSSGWFRAKYRPRPIIIYKFSVKIWSVLTGLCCSIGLGQCTDSWLCLPHLQVLLHLLWASIARMLIREKLAHLHNLLSQHIAVGVVPVQLFKQISGCNACVKHSQRSICCKISPTRCAQKRAQQGAHALSLALKKEGVLLQCRALPWKFCAEAAW